ncbi:hydrolase [Bacillus sp. D386]|uniref:hydrolase n=1 Tax=Bacillus sp. D386 TaxID=2587155 RepID=UPI00111EDDEC|nr:hydrolase [Bacillus sp. D386]
MINHKTFQLNKEWTTIFYPEQPSGFAIMLLGGDKHYINEKANFWLDHPGKKQMLEYLLKRGYTVFSSYLSGAHWGNAEAADLAMEMYAFFIRKEIVNERIHIIAEGTGALVLDTICHKLKEKVRSVVLLNPILSVKQSYEKEEINKFFFKKMKKELYQAYHLNDHTFKEWMEKKPDTTLGKDMPVLIVHVLDRLESNLPVKYSSFINNHPSSEIKYITPEKRYIIPYQINSFFKNHEKDL